MIEFQRPGEFQKLHPDEPGRDPITWEARLLLFEAMRLDARNVLEDLRNRVLPIYADDFRNCEALTALLIQDVDGDGLEDLDPQALMEQLPDSNKIEIMGRFPVLQHKGCRRGGPPPSVAEQAVTDWTFAKAALRGSLLEWATPNGLNNDIFFHLVLRVLCFWLLHPSSALNLSVFTDRHTDGRNLLNSLGHAFSIDAWTAHETQLNYVRDSASGDEFPFTKSPAERLSPWNPVTQTWDVYKSWVETVINQHEAEVRAAYRAAGFTLVPDSSTLMDYVRWFVQYKVLGKEQQDIYNAYQFPEDKKEPGLSAISKGISIASKVLGFKLPKKKK